MDFIGYKLLLILTITITLTSSQLLLTPLIEKNSLDEARNLSSVNPSYFLNTTSYSGFFTVDKNNDSNIFFWYFPVAGKLVNETPWIVWLQGGPGVSSLVGLFEEIGPFKFDNELKPRNTSWGQNYSLLFIDNPVGAGFSYSNNGYVHDMETCADHLYTALKQFMTLFPEHKTAPLFIAGESYAGQYLPALGTKILEQHQKSDMDINLQGIIMGNPVLNRKDVADLSSIYYQWGLIDSQGLLATKHLQDNYNNAIKNNSSDVEDIYEQLLNKLNNIAGRNQTYNVLEEINMLSFISFESFLSRPNIKEALHVGNRTFILNNNKAYIALTSNFLNDVRPKIERLLDHSRILIYCGQLDMLFPCVPNALGRRKFWHWKNKSEFLSQSRTPWVFDDKIAGYVKSGGGLTEVLVAGAGHLVPLDKPAEALQLISYFISNEGLPQPYNYASFDEDTPLYNDGEVITANNRSNISGFTVSIVINVILGLVLIMGVIYVLHWRRKAIQFYNIMDDNTSLTDGMLTM